MSHTSRAVLLGLVCAGLVFAGCVPNSFRIASADNLHDRILFPPGAVRTHEKLDLHVETQIMQCKGSLPTRKSGPITVSNPYWHAVGSRVLRIEVANYATEMTIPPPAHCLNRTVRPAPHPNKCPQDHIVDNVWSIIQDNTDWSKCVGRNARTQLLADVSNVLPHRASEAGTLREERTYAHPPARVDGLSAEVIRLLPGAIVCVNRDHTLVYSNEKAWMSSHACSHLLDAPDASGRVILSRTDTEDMFPLASEYKTEEAKIYEVHSWVTVRGMLVAMMPRGAFLYVYYSGLGTANKPELGTWEYHPEASMRKYPKGADPGTPIPLTPILIAHSQPLKLTKSDLPNLEELCKGSGDDRKRCFAFPDFATIDVLRPYSVNGLIHYAPSGTLTTDIPEIVSSRHPLATRVFHGRTVPMDFDVQKAENAVPLAAGDQFGGRQ